MSNHFKLIVPGTLNTEKAVYNCVLSCYLKGKRLIPELFWSPCWTSFNIFMWGKKKTPKNKTFPTLPYLFPSKEAELWDTAVKQALLCYSDWQIMTKKKPRRGGKPVRFHNRLEEQFSSLCSFTFLSEFNWERLVSSVMIHRKYFKCPIT